MATYTVGADGTVAFYEVTTINQDKDKDPLATINLRDIIKYVNDQNAVSQIKSRAQQIHVKQPVDANSEEDDEWKSVQSVGRRIPRKINFVKTVVPRSLNKLRKASSQFG